MSVTINGSIGINTPNITPATSRIPTISATVASNAITIGMSPTYLDFRSSTLSDGAVTPYWVSPTNLVVPSSATLGTVSAVASRLVIIVMDNAGTAELGIVNLAGGLNLDETTLVSTTAIDATATSSSIIYSTAARTNLAFRVVGFIDSTQATAGTWATAPSTIQGVGGQVGFLMNGLGNAYGYINSVPGSRVIGTTYYNTTGRPLFVTTGLRGSAAGTYSILYLNGTAASYFQSPATNYVGNINFLVPNGMSYRITGTAGTITINYWVEYN